MRSHRGKLLRLAGLTVATAAFLYILRDIQPKQVWLSLSNIDPIYLLPMLIGVVGMPLVRAVRIKFIMDPMHSAPTGRVFSIYNVGQLLNILLPALTGQVARILLFSRTLSITKTFAFTAVILEVLFDGLILVVMIFAASFLVVMPEWLVKGEVVVLLACVLLLGFFYLVLHRHREPERSPSILRRKCPDWLVAKWDGMKDSFLAGLDMLTSRRHLLLVVLLSVLSWVSHAVIVLFLLKGFGFNIPFWGAIIILIVNTLAIMIPVSPGNFGVFQIACVLGLGFFHVPKDDALAFSLVLHVVELGPVFALGAIASFSHHVRISEYTDAETLEEESLVSGLDNDNTDASVRSGDSDSTLERETVVSITPRVTPNTDTSPPLK